MSAAASIPATDPLAEARARLSEAEARHADVLVRHRALQDRAVEAGQRAAAADRKRTDAVWFAADGLIALDEVEGAALDADAAGTAAHGDRHERIARAAARHVDQAAFEVAHARAAFLIETVRAAVAVEIELAEEFDRAMAAAQAALEKLQAAGAASADATRACAAFDLVEMQTLASTNTAAAEAKVAGAPFPRTGIAARPSLTSFTVQLLWRDNYRRQHRVAGRLADWLAHGWGRLAPPGERGRASLAPISRV